LLLYNCRSAKIKGLELKPDSLLQDLTREDVETPLPGATWYYGERIGDGLSYSFVKGALSDYTFLTADMLLDSHTVCGFQLRLHEENNGPTFTLNFKLLNQCSARLRINLQWVDQNL